MLLDDLLPIREPDRSIKKVDWIFSTTGFVFLFFSLTFLLFLPEKQLELFCFGSIIITPFFMVFVGIATMFFLFGGMYALINRILKIKTDYKLAMIHYSFSLFAVIVLLWKLGNEVTLVTFSMSDVFTSMMSLTSFLVFAQLLFLINAFLGIVKR